MKTYYLSLLVAALMLLMAAGAPQTAAAQSRRPVDSAHPMWLIHVDVWNKADPQKIIDLIPDDIKPYVVMNLSLSCQYDTEKNVYKMPQNAIKTYKSWGTVCQHNGMWFTCQPASGGHTHIQDDDLETFEYFYKRFPNFLGWNYAEQFWGFDEAGDKSSSTQSSRIALFAKLVPMAHKYGGFLTVSFCGNIWSHPLNPVGMMKRNKDLLQACKDYPEAMLWLYKYTTSSCFYNNESVTFSPFISGLAKNYGVRYDNCGWNGALDALLGEKHGKKYPVAAGIGTVMEQTAVNGGAVWDGPELIWTEDFQNLNNSTVNGYTRRNWGTFPGFKNAWMDMFRKFTSGAIYIPTRQEVVEKTKIVVLNDVSSGNDEQKYAAWGDLYDGLYKQTDPMNRGNGQWMDNFCYFKKTGRYGTIPVAIGLYDETAKKIPVQVRKTSYTTKWPSQARKLADFNAQYPAVSTGDLYVNRYKNQLITYTPYSYLNSKTTANATIPLLYNTCEELVLNYGKLSSGAIREYADRIEFYLNNYRTDTTAMKTDVITVKGAKDEPSFSMTKRAQATANTAAVWNAETGEYTLTVDHNGPVDITLHCEGTATDRSEDIIANSEPDLPKQPEEYFGEVIIEAEDMDYKSVNSCVTDPYGWYPSVRGHAGNGFMDMGTNTQGALRHVFKARKAGVYYVDVRYTCSTKAPVLSVLAGSTRKSLRGEKTAVNEWRKMRMEATLKEGDNTLNITNAGGAPLYIDNVTYTPVDAETELFGITIRDAEHGRVTAETDSAAEGDLVRLTVTPDEGYALSGWKVVHGDVTVSADGSFTMPDDNVTLQPIFADVTAVYKLDFTDVLGGTMPAGWQCEQDGGDIHKYPDSYSSGARTFAGFSGYQGKALYWRVGYAEYGRLAGQRLVLKPGWHRLSFASAAWKGTPKFSVSVTKIGGGVVAQSDVVTATPNANGNSAANVTRAVTYTTDFEVKETGNYVIRFSNESNSSGFDEYLILECRVNTIADPTSIGDIKAGDAQDAPAAGNGAIYGLGGERRRTMDRGVNVVGDKLKVVK